ncbi:unnamed protein product, partial [Polarella glacialis]
MSRFALLRCAAGFQRSVPIPIPQFQAAGCRPTRQVTGAPAWVLQTAFGGTAVLAASVASWRAPVQKRRLSTARCVRNEGPPQARCWLVVLDFDCTIMVEHLWARYRDAPLAKVHIQDDTFVDLAALRRFVASVRAGGHNVAVASFGRRDVIDKGLRVALGEEHQVVITTPADFGCPEGSGLLGNKNRQLAGLCDRFQATPDRILLVDDDAHNVEAALKAGFSALHAPAGLTGVMLGAAAMKLGLELDSPGFGESGSP